MKESFNISSAVRLCSVLLFATAIHVYAELPTQDALSEKSVFHSSDQVADEISLDFGSLFYEQWIRDRLTIGLTFSSFSLSDPDRPADPNREETFIGAVNHLDEVDENSFTLSASYQACNYLVIGVGYGEVTARTLNFNNHLSDGNVSISGPMFTAQFIYPVLDGRLRPHVGLGYAMWKSDFEHDAWWHLNYSSPESYAATGGKGSVHGYYREIRVEDESSVYWTLGCGFRPFPHLELDLSMRSMSIEPANAFVYTDGGASVSTQRTGEFTLDNTAWMLTISYVF